MSNSRYQVLDSYRALAALLVVAFHYFHRWGAAAGDSQLLPDIEPISSNTVVQNGALGVEFFFMISGFVIALTLRNTKSLSEFSLKRFARLFPAMLFASMVTFLAVRFMAVEPLSDVSWVDFVPSLTFMAPYVYNTLFGVDMDWISGVYWSLFVEVKFYFYVSIIYFMQPTHALRNFTLLSIALCGLFLIASATSTTHLVTILDLVFFAKYAGFFVAGMAFFQIFSSPADNRSWPVLALILLTYLVQSFIYSPLLSTSPYGWVATVMIFVFYLMFWLFATGSSFCRFLDVRWLAQIGAASYSLYLLHESIGVSAIHLLNEKVSPSLLWTPIVLIAMIITSMLVYRLIETPSRRFIGKTVRAR